MNNLKLLQANIHLIENIKLFTEVNKKIFELITEKLKSGEQITIEDLELDNQLLEKINKFAPIKYILKNKSNNDQKIRPIYTFGCIHLLCRICLPLVLRATRGRTIYSSLGSINLELWNLLQTNAYRSENQMSVTALLMIAIVVFCLMITGLFTTMREVQKAEDPSVRKGTFTDPG